MHDRKKECVRERLKEEDNIKEERQNFKGQMVV